MKVFVIKYDNGDDIFVATEPTHEDALQYIAENAKELYEENPQNFWADSHPEVLEAINAGDGEVILEDWYGFSGDSASYTLTEVEMCGGFKLV